jgi:hypothetical protein
MMSCLRFCTLVLSSTGMSDLSIFRKGTFLLQGEPGSLDGGTIDSPSRGNTGTALKWWNLADKPVSSTPSQYKDLTDQIIPFIHPAECTRGTYAGPVGNTSRPVQPLNGRTSECICATSASSTTATLSFTAAAATLLAGAALFF